MYKLLCNKCIILWMYHSLIVFLLLGIKLFLGFCFYKNCWSKLHIFLFGYMLKFFLQVTDLEIEFSGRRVFAFKVLRSIKWNNLGNTELQTFNFVRKGPKKITDCCYYCVIKGHFNTWTYLILWKSHSCQYFSHFTIDYWKFSIYYFASEQTNPKELLLDFGKYNVLRTEPFT